MLFALLLVASLAVDQVGYPSHAPKLAIVGVAPPSAAFTLSKNGKIVFKGEIRNGVADFSSVTAPGDYDLTAGSEHATIHIADDPYRDLQEMTMRAFTGQRCGTAVDIGGGYAHPACHTSSKARGGWHDAGDYGRYVVNSGISTGTLLWAIEMLGLDMRDEVRWNVDWMMRMQDADGSVWVKETSKDFAPFVMPQDDKSEQLLIGKSSCAAADFAAVTAIASRVYQSQTYLDASKRAYEWASAHPDVTFRNPRGILTGEYGDADCSDERAWARAELFRTTHDGAYAGAPRFAIEPADWKHVGSLAAWTYAMADGARPNDIRATTIAAADAIVARAQHDPYRIPMRPRDYVWGSNAVAANYGMLLLVANRFQPKQAYVDTTLEILHYLLGRNQFGMSFVTGTGTKSPMHPHHRPSVADGISAPWPGLLVGGPNPHRQDPVMRKLPIGTAYVDETGSYSTNEVAINWNAPLVFDLAGIRCSDGLQPVDGALKRAAPPRGERRPRTAAAPR